MDKILTYTLREEDLGKTAQGLVNLVLKNCVRVTGHEISAAKYTEDGITCDGKLIHVSDRMLPGQTLRVILPEDPQKEGRMVPAEGRLDILYEDEDLLIVNKPAGVVVHPSPGHYQDSMANLVAGYYAGQGIPTVARIIGRLDRETSGVLAFAKNRASAARLSRERQTDALRRTYLAVAEGVPDPPQGEINRPVAAIPGVLMKRQVTEDTKTGARAITHYEVLWHGSLPGREISLVRCRIETGRTHQIRLHMASTGHPLVGDCIYGSDAAAPRREGEIPEAGVRPHPETRAMLHAVSLTLCQPFTGERITVRAPLPADFSQVLAAAGCPFRDPDLLSDPSDAQG